MDETKNEKDYMSVAEVAELLDVCDVAVRGYCIGGLLKFYKMPGKTGAYRIDRKSVQEFRRKLLAGKI